MLGCAAYQQVFWHYHCCMPAVVAGGMYGLEFDIDKVGGMSEQHTMHSAALSDIKSFLNLDCMCQ